MYSFVCSPLCVMQEIMYNLSQCLTIQMINQNKIRFYFELFKFAQCLVTNYGNKSLCHVKLH